MSLKGLFGLFNPGHKPSGEGDELLWAHLVSEMPFEIVDDDTGEVSEIRPTQGDPNEVEGLLVAFDYENAAGGRSRRALLCSQAWKANSLIYVRGLCGARHSIRTFRGDRMANMIEARTLRKINDSAAYFAEYCDDGDEESSPTLRARAAEANEAMKRRVVDQQRRRDLRAARKAVTPGIRLLNAVALVDSDRSVAEDSVVRSYIMERLTMVGIGLDERGMEELCEWAAAVVPTSGALSRVATELMSKDHRELVYKWVRMMITVDGRVDDEEAAILQDFLGKLRRAAARVTS